MAFARGRFGIEYNPVRRDAGERPFITWAALVLLTMGGVSFLVARGCTKKLAIPDSLVPPPQESLPAGALAPQGVTAAPPAPAVPSPAPAAAERPKMRSATPAPARKPPSAFQRTVEIWLADSRERPPVVRTLLERLWVAERDANPTLALETIVRLRQHPAVADLDDSLARRLGALNWHLLVSDAPSPWTVSFTARRGDTYHRIARENGTTVAAVRTLNRVPATAAAPKAGDRLRIISFPKAALVIHRQTKQADIFMSGKFFKRYYTSPGAKTPTGSWSVTREKGPKTRLQELGMRIAPVDLEEIALLLPPNATITITDP